MPGNMADNPRAPEQQPQEPPATPALAFLLINPNKDHEKEMSKIHTTMLDLREREKAAEAEELAVLLLSYTALPIPYRAFAHMVSLLPPFRSRFPRANDNADPRIW
jgi:hypothetical protein